MLTETRRRGRHDLSQGQPPGPPELAEGRPINFFSIESVTNGRRFFVVEVRVCADCGGSGVVPNGAWESDAARDPRTDPRQFWREHGPEDLPCGGCAGGGTRAQHVELAKALADLGLLTEAVRA